jgi:hypothetical protein
VERPSTDVSLWMTWASIWAWSADPEPRDHDPASAPSVLGDWCRRRASFDTSSASMATFLWKIPSGNSM